MIAGSADGEAMKYSCPKCHKMLQDVGIKKGESTETNIPLPKYFPFCSERCKLLDFGAWIDEDYRVPAIEDDDIQETTDNESQY